MKKIAIPYLMQGTYHPDWAKSELSNSAHLKAILPHSVIVHHYNMNNKKIDIYKYQEAPKVRFFFVHDHNLIQYGVKVQTLAIEGMTNLHTATQVSVWRNKVYAGSSGIARFFFNSILKPEFGSVLSDETQSEEGRDFWIQRVAEALQLRFPVYVLTLHDSGNYKKQCTGIVPILDADLMHQYYTTDHNLSGAQYRFLIAKSPI